MPLLFIEYTNLVLEAYEKRRDANQLSRLLMHPTTANIRQECLNVFNERIINDGQVEEDILRAFFGVPPPGKKFDFVIERFNADKFRPIRSLMKREIRHPALVSVELLAWLIDFKPRPLAYAQKIFAATSGQNGNAQPGNDGTTVNMGDDLSDGEQVIKIEESGAGNPGKEKTVEENIQPVVNKGKLSALARIPKINLASVIGTTVAILSIVAFLLTLGADDHVNTNGGCMQWVNDHFEKVPCTEQSSGLPVLPMDKKKMEQFRMITRTDTMTAWSIGKVYYIKDRGKIKYYTEEGFYPEDPRRRLKVLSPYMFDKYLRKQSGQAQGLVEK